MSTLPKCRRVKRPTIIAKRSQLAKKNAFKKRSYKPLYEKLKANNRALAKALSKEKQEYQYLASQNIILTGEVQELGVACNKRDDIISGVLKNAKESLQLLIALSGHVTNTIASCQQVITTTRYTPKKSASSAERRESMRRLSGKSPARGVVQPMVSGHMITKPTINLSRLNIQREYRVTSSPNLSNIDEVPTTPEQSPATVESMMPIRIPIARPLNLGTRRVVRLPERLRGSLRTSDEDERRSSGGSNRNSNRYSGRRSRPSSERRSSNGIVSRRSNSDIRENHEDERLKSPRVALHDVSRLLQNSQSVNIRTLLDNSSDLDLTQLQQNEETILSEHRSINESAETTNVTISQDSSANVENGTMSNINESKDSKEEKTTSQNETDDPLEGPSWLLNDSEVASPSSEHTTTTTKSTLDLSQKSQENEKNHQSDVNNENKNSQIIENQITPRILSRAGQEKVQKFENHTNENDDKIDEVEDDEQTVNLATRWANYTGNFYRNLNDDQDDRTETNIMRFVTRKRGSNVDDDDDFTLMWRPQQMAGAKNYNFDLNDLELPVLESPIVTATQIRPSESEETTKVLRINTPNFMSNPGPVCSRNDDDDSFYDDRRLGRPLLPDNSDLRCTTSIVEHNEQSDEDDSAPRKRKRPYKKIKMFDSPNNSEYLATPKRTNTKNTRDIEGKKKDPSSAKVVLKKLNASHVKKRSASPENLPSRDSDNHQQMSSSSVRREPSSDSEVSSNASSKDKVQTRVLERPRRQKAPKNLQEPSLTTKLRRN